MARFPLLATVAIGIGLMIPTFRRDGATHWLPHTLRGFTLAILNFMRVW